MVAVQEETGAAHTVEADAVHAGRLEMHSGNRHRRSTGAVSGAKVRSVGHVSWYHDEYLRTADGGAIQRDLNKPVRGRSRHVGDVDLRIGNYGVGAGGGSRAAKIVGERVWVFVFG